MSNAAFAKQKNSSNAKGFLWRTKSTTWPLTFNGYVPDDPYWPNEKSTFWLVLWKKCLLVRFQLLVSLHLILSAVNCVRLVDLSSLKNSLSLPRCFDHFLFCIHSWCSSFDGMTTRTRQLLIILQPWSFNKSIYPTLSFSDSWIIIYLRM